jgi:exoribonuclease II
MQLINTGSKPPIVHGITIDGNGARILDDGLCLKRKPEGGWILQASYANPAYIIEKDSQQDKIARSRAITVYDPKNKKSRNRISMIDEAGLEEAVSFAEGAHKEALTVEFHFDENAELQPAKTKIFESLFCNQKALSERDFLELSESRNPLLIEWVEFFALRRVGLMRYIDAHIHEQFNCASVMPRLSDDEMYELAIKDLSNRFMNIIADTKSLARQAFTEAFSQCNLPGIRADKFRKDIKLICGNESVLGYVRSFFAPIIDVSPKIVMTQPIRDYACLVNMRILTSHLRGEPLAYTQNEVEEIKREYDAIVKPVEKAEKHYVSLRAPIEKFSMNVGNIYMTVFVYALEQAANKKRVETAWSVGLTRDLARTLLSAEIDKYKENGKPRLERKVA